MNQHLTPKTNPLLLIGSLATVALLFAPLVDVHFYGQQENLPPDATLFGFALIGRTDELNGLLPFQQTQVIAICLMLTGWMVAILYHGRLRMTALAFIAFLLSMVPVWVMLFVEGFIKGQTSPHLEYNYAFGIVCGMIALFCATFAMPIRIEERTPFFAEADTALDGHLLRAKG